ncbi:MAG: MotA/TolQ/ExbB proton channel family protein [Nitrospiria bacterium]
MATLHESLGRIGGFLEMGGPVLWGILLLSTLLWVLILERYWFLWVTHRSVLRHRITEWQSRRDKDSWYARRIREGMISETASALQHSLFLIKTLTGALPLLGLLGTVTGMIQTFDVMTLFGTGNVRGMAGGISEALITTMAGLVTALSGLYFSVDLERRAAVETERASDLLTRH